MNRSIISSGDTASQSSELNDRLPLAIFENAAVRLRQRHIFEQTNWVIGPDQQWLLTGPNGAGKSSLARALVGRLPIVQGRLTYPGLVTPRLDIEYVAFERMRRLLNLGRRKTQALHFGRQFSRPVTGKDGFLPIRLGGEPEKDRFFNLLRQIEATDLLDRPLLGLSSGELQKLLLARALSRKVRLLVLDEPFDGLDSASRKQFNRLIASRIHRQTQVVLITQRPSEIPNWITHELIVHNCRVVDRRQRYQRPNASSQGPPNVLPNRPLPMPWTVGAGRVQTLEPVVDMRGVTVSYGPRIILNRLSWRMNTGENWAVLGPNGSGKTTLLSLITGDHPQAYANDISLFGRKRGSGESIWELKHRIGLVSGEMHHRYQKPIPVMDVVLSGFFDTVGRYHRIDDRQLDSARRWLRFFELTDLEGHQFTRLSFGQQRLVLIARAVVKSPAVLVLDEPCQGLDAENRARVRRLVEAVGVQTATQLLHVTHHPMDMLSCVDRILRLTPSPSGGFAGICENGPAAATGG